MSIFLLSMAAGAALAVAALAMPAAAAPQLLVPWQTSGNGTIKGDDFASVPNMDMLFRGFSGFGDSRGSGSHVCVGVVGGDQLCLLPYCAGRHDRAAAGCRLE